MGAPPNLPPAPGSGISLVPGMGAYPPGMVPQFMTVPPPGFGSFKPVSIFFSTFFFQLNLFFWFKRTESCQNGLNMYHLIVGFIITIQQQKKVHGLNQMSC